MIEGMKEKGPMWNIITWKVDLNISTKFYNVDHS